jgi:hypothetical protein
MSILTVRISDEEKALLARRAKVEGTTTGALVRRLIQEKSFVTSADLLAEMQSLLGDKRLAIHKPKRA